MLTDDEIMAQVLAAFQAEQREHRQAIGELLLELERDPSHPQRRSLLDQLFRHAHSLKGGARAAGQFEVEQIAHAIEDLFSAVRHETVQLTAEVCDPIYAALDAIGALMNQVAAGQPISLAAYQPLLATFERIGRNTADSEPDAVLDATSGDLQNGSRTNGDHPTNRHHTPGSGLRPALTVLDRTISVPGVEEQRGLTDPPGEPRRLPIGGWGGESAETTVRIATTSLDALLHETGELMTCTVRHRQRTREAQQLLELFARWRRVWRMTRPMYAKLQGQTELRPAVHYLPGYEAVAAPTTVVADREMHMLLHALDQAHELIGDLELQLGAQVREMAEDSARLEAVSERLHSQVRRTRMLPLATLWGPVRLQVREMARSAGKEVTLDLDDGGADADRQVLDQLREVLLHLLRNALDHGIETPSQRIAAGKSGAGRLALRASVSGDRLVIVLSDDGTGLDFQAIQERALATGLLTTVELAHIGPAELTELIFVPGFSTRTTVSALSGRGVGLDIVRAQVERMHGRVTVHSTPGAGCTFTLSVPLSLTSAHALLLEADDRLYALPVEAVQSVMTVTPDSIQLLEGRSMLALDQRPIPLAHLGDVLHESTAPSTRSQSSGIALLLSIGERQVACLVDAVLGEQELMVQRLPAPLQQIQYVTGATILPDGRIAPILDVVDLVRGVVGTRRMVRMGAAPESAPRKPRVLVVDDSITTRTLEKNILTAAGYEVLLAVDGVEALTLLTQFLDMGGCDLVVSDVDMPRLNGFDLTTHIRNNPRLQDLPVVLMTSLDTAADRERGIAAGADAYLVKRGFDQSYLLDLIAGLL